MIRPRKRSPNLILRYTMQHPISFPDTVSRLSDIHFFLFAIVHLCTFSVVWALLPLTRVVWLAAVLRFVEDYAEVVILTFHPVFRRIQLARRCEGNLYRSS